MSLVADRNQEATVYVGNLDERVTEEILWDLFTQTGPILTVHMPRDRVSQTHQNYGFVEFQNEGDAEYAVKIMNMVKLYGKPIKVNKASADKKTLDIGAKLFVGNLDDEVDEKTLQEVFGVFGTVIQVSITRDPDTNISKGYGFVGYDSFEGSDAALGSMNGQVLLNKSIMVSYAFKKDAKGEKHGSMAERLLAGQTNIPY